MKLLDGWSSRRFTAPGWPGDDAYFYLIDGRARAVSEWLIAVVVLAGWVLCRRVFEKLPQRHLGLVVLMIASLLLGSLLPSRHAGYTWGLFGGGLLVLVAELGVGLGKLRQLRRRRSESSLVRRAARGGAGHGDPGAARGASRLRSRGDRARRRRVDACSLSL